MHHLDNRGDELLEHCCCFRGLEFKGRDVYLENRHMVTDVEVVHRNMFLNIGIDAHAGTIRGQTQLHPRNRCVTEPHLSHHLQIAAK